MSCVVITLNSFAETFFVLLCAGSTLSLKNESSLRCGILRVSFLEENLTFFVCGTGLSNILVDNGDIVSIDEGSLSSFNGDCLLKLLPGFNGLSLS